MAGKRCCSTPRVKTHRSATYRLAWGLGANRRGKRLNSHDTARRPHQVTPIHSDSRRWHQV